MTHTERFAPSPTGPLHLGHAYSAITAWNNAQAAEGKFLLRIEDIDQSRARPQWEAQIYDELTWLGLTWPKPVRRQSDQMSAYHAALSKLWELDLLYPCTCTRHDIRAATSAPQEGAPLLGPDGVIYHGTCRSKPKGTKHLPEAATLRLDMRKAAAHIGETSLTFTETGVHEGCHAVSPSDLIETAGDIVLARKDMGTSYHLSVVVDDAAQAITHVTRGADLFDATPIHVMLQRLLSLPTPAYHHHALIRDENGKRLAKRDDAKAIQKLKEDGARPQDIYAMIGITPLVPK